MVMWKSLIPLDITLHAFSVLTVYGSKVLNTTHEFFSYLSEKKNLFKILG